MLRRFKPAEDRSPGRSFVSVVVICWARQCVLKQCGPDGMLVNLCVVRLVVVSCNCWDPASALCNCVGSASVLFVSCGFFVV